MRISDWSSDVCSSDLRSKWSRPKSPPPGFSLSLSLVYGSRNFMHDEYALVQINLQVKRRSLRRGLIIDLNAAVRALAPQRYEAGYIIAQTRAHDARHRRRPCLSPVAHRPTKKLKWTSTYHRDRKSTRLNSSH